MPALRTMENATCLRWYAGRGAESAGAGCGALAAAPTFSASNRSAQKARHLIDKRASGSWWRWGDSNPRPLTCEASALPAELLLDQYLRPCLSFCGRTGDSLASVVPLHWLFQESPIRYFPRSVCVSRDHQESGHALLYWNQGFNGIGDAQGVRTRESVSLIRR